MPDGILPRAGKKTERTTNPVQTIAVSSVDEAIPLLLPAEIEDGHLVSDGKQRLGDVFKLERRNGGHDPVRVDECHSHPSMIMEIGRTVRVDSRQVKSFLVLPGSGRQIADDGGSIPPSGP